VGSEGVTLWLVCAVNIWELYAVSSAPSQQGDVTAKGCDGFGMGATCIMIDYVPVEYIQIESERSPPMKPQEKLDELRCSPAHAQAVESYSNKFVNGAGMQRPGTRGFELWLLYSIHTKQTGNPPNLREAIDLAKEYGLNTTSASNALGKWSAYYGFRPPRTGDYAVGPRS
jgi:hypothetical protein